MTVDVIKYWRVYAHMSIASVRSIGLFLLCVKFWRYSWSVFREYIRMLLHPISKSLAESSYLISNVWHIKIMMQSVIDNRNNSTWLLQITNSAVSSTQVIERSENQRYSGKIADISIFLYFYIFIFTYLHIYIFIYLSLVWLLIHI